MATRLICPECDATLRPAREVPDGVRVKCPKCGAPFTAPGRVDAAPQEEEEAPKAKAKANAKQVKKEKPAAKKQAAAKPKAGPGGGNAYGEDVDDDGGTYELLDKPGTEGAGIKISYELDTSIKDLRGPAVTLIVPPSNLMLFTSSIGCLLCLVAVLTELWPFMFSDHLKDHRQFFDGYYLVRHPGQSQDDFQKGLLRKKSIPDERKDLHDDEKELLDKVEALDALKRIVLAVIYFVLMIYESFIVVGASKMQNMESRAWGIVAAIMTIIPLSTGWVIYYVKFFFWDLVFSNMFDEADQLAWFSYANFLQGVLLSVTGGLVVAIGIWSLKVLNHPDVIAGYEYVPDDGS